MIEWGIFNDEGCIEAGFYSQIQAEQAAGDLYADDDVTVEQICPDHEEHPAYGCEECATDEEVWE